MFGLNVVFVDIGYFKDVFLYYIDLGFKFKLLFKFMNGVMLGGINIYIFDNFKMELDIIKIGKVDQVFSKKQFILVQVFKELIFIKGLCLSCEFILLGCYIVFMLFFNVVVVFKKISNVEECKCFYLLVESICLKSFGVIVCIVAEGKKVVDLYEEIIQIMQSWEDIYKQLYKAKLFLKLLSELDKILSILRDVLMDFFNWIVVNDKQMY